MLLADLQWADGTEVVASPAPDPAPPARPPRRARPGRQRRHRARVHRLQGHLRGGLEEGLPRPRAGQPLQHRLLAAGLGPGRAADPADPQRDGRRRDDGRELEGRVQPRPARDQLPLQRGAGGRRRPRRSTRTAPRRSPPRRRWRSRSWRSSTRRRATRATSTARSRRTAVDVLPNLGRKPGIIWSPPPALSLPRISRAAIRSMPAMWYPLSQGPGHHRTEQGAVQADHSFGRERPGGQ